MLIKIYNIRVFKIIVSSTVLLVFHRWNTGIKVNTFKADEFRRVRMCPGVPHQNETNVTPLCRTAITEKGLSCRIKGLFLLW